MSEGRLQSKLRSLSAAAGVVALCVVGFYVALRDTNGLTPSADASPAPAPPKHETNASAPAGVRRSLLPGASDPTVEPKVEAPTRIEKRAGDGVAVVKGKW